MQTVRMSWPVMAIVLLALLACLGALVDANPTQIKVPGQNASSEEVSRYYELVFQKYKHAIPQRFGKRDIPEAVLWKLLFPDSQDSSVKSRPEGTYML